MTSYDKHSHVDRPPATWCIVAILAVAILSIAAIALPGCPPRHNKRLVSLLELETLSQATYMFQHEHGHNPPSASIESVQDHLLSLDPQIDMDRIDVPAIATLDDAERLVFWLGGSFPEIDCGFKRLRLFDFDYSQLLDRDNDGSSKPLARRGFCALELLRVLGFR